MQLIAHGAERQRAVLTNADTVVHAHGLDAVPDSDAAEPAHADANAGRHRYSSHTNADFRDRIDAHHGDADLRAGDPHADRAGYGNASHARTDGHAVRGHADSDAPLNGLSPAARV
ncbi:MAG TPA: hypothetical protein VF554_03710 [Thermoanaerobaculia bacterium]